MQVDDEEDPESCECPREASDTDPLHPVPVDGAPLPSCDVGVERDHEHEEHDRDEGRVDEADDRGDDHREPHTRRPLDERGDEDRRCDDRECEDRHPRTPEAPRALRGPGVS
ncbi:Uncharacterised protein [Mycobacteroides abscessus subsp. abscessus]|nr:Uncharacterised protein [Mycobacteroides abscessus subsp. abscessus]